MSKEPVPTSPDVIVLRRKLARAQRLLLLAICLPFLVVAMGPSTTGHQQEEQEQTGETARPATFGALSATSNAISNATSITDPDDRSRLLIAPNQNGEICLYLYKNSSAEPVKYIKVEDLLRDYP